MYVNKILNQWMVHYINAMLLKWAPYSNCPNRPSVYLSVCPKKATQVWTDSHVYVMSVCSVHLSFCLSVCPSTNLFQNDSFCSDLSFVTKPNIYITHHSRRPLMIFGSKGQWSRSQVRVVYIWPQINFGMITPVLINQSYSNFTHV